MRGRIGWMAGLAAVLAVPARAGDLSPGLWEITLESRVAAQPGFAPAPFRVTQCLSAADAADPSRVLGPLSSQGAGDCTYLSREYSGDTLSFRMRCGGSLGIESQGRIRFGADTMEGSITATANTGGSTVEMQNRVSARRLGGC